MTFKARLKRLEVSHAAPEILTVITHNGAHYWHTKNPGINYRHDLEAIEPANPPEGATCYTRADLEMLEQTRSGLQIIVIQFTDKAPNMGINTTGA